MLKIISSFVLLLGLSASCHADSLNKQAEELNKQPFPKVYRSVLDKEVRQLSYRLDNNTAISYDTWRCKLSAAWIDKEGKLIDYGSAVHDGRHGPQPTRLGRIVFSNKAAEYQSSLGTVQFAGHRFLNNTLLIKFAIKDNSGQTIATISEVPTWKAGMLSRKVTVTPAHTGSSITFTPTTSTKWQNGTKQFTSATLANAISISTNLK